MSDPIANRSLAVFLLDVKGLRAVNVTYEGFDPHTKKPVGNLTLFKTMIADLAVGDLVLVPTGTRVGFTAVQVAELDVEPDLESTKEVGWIVAKLDISAYAGLIAKEKQLISAINDADKRARQEELKKRLLGNVDPSTLPVIDLTALPAPKDDGAASS